MLGSSLTLTPLRVACYGDDYKAVFGTFNSPKPLCGQAFARPHKPTVRPVFTFESIALYLS